MSAPMIPLAMAAALLFTPVADRSPAVGAPGISDASSETHAFVEVRNYNSADIEVYAVSEEGRRFHIGTVNRLSQKVLALPSCLSAGEQFRLKIYTYAPRPPASVVRRLVEGVKTNPLSASAGQKIELVVNNPLTDTFINHVTGP